MDFEETMVENVDDTPADDTPEEEIVEETDESEEDLGDFAETEEPAEEEPQQKEQSQGTGDEPGWFRKRWDKEVGKLTEKIRNEIRGEYEAQMAPIRAKMMEDEAQELVRSRKVTDIETARELVRLRNGQPAAAPQAEQSQAQPRQANGQFASKEDPGVTARIEMLRHQAERIAKNGGPDVRAEFTNNEDIKKKVIAGEMDFYDVADYLKEKSSKKRPPSPMRSPNGASGQSPNAIESMTDEQFARMEKRISEGARIRLR
jgi:hypothetical protein